MRNMVTGLLVFIFGVGFGLGAGLAVNRLQAVKPMAQVVQSTGDSIKSVDNPMVENPLEVLIVTPADVPEPENAVAEYLTQTDSKIAELQQRITALESLNSPQADARPVRRNALDEQSLRQAGFDQTEVVEIIDLYNQQQLKRLEVRDRAIREGWINSDQFRSAMRELRDQSMLKSSLGDRRFDQFLLSQGINNRVRVDEVMTGSSAEQAGVFPGDVISRYADATIYNVQELRNATSAGERDDWVVLSVYREGAELQLSVQRGPLGVSVSGTQIDPGN